MGLDEAPTDRQPEPGPRRLGREVGVEQLLAQLLGDARTIVADRDLDLVADPYTDRITAGMEVEAERRAGDRAYERCVITAVRRETGLLTVAFFDGSSRDVIDMTVSILPPS